jgi:phage-related tail fiber protein
MATKVLNGLDLQSQKITNLASPSSAADAVNKTYVDALVNGLDWKASVRAASTATVTVASPGTTLDGVTLAANDRVLLKNQSTGSQNGIYVWTASGSPLTRATDADADVEVTANMTVFVEEGTVNADTAWTLTNNGAIVVGTTALTFTQFGGGSTTYVAGNGLTLTGATFDVVGGTGITVAADLVSVDFSVVPKKFAVNVGDGSTTAITITHNLNTRDVVVKVYTNSTPWDEIIVDVTLPSVNTATLTFATAPASAAYRAVVIG